MEDVFNRFMCVLQARNHSPAGGELQPGTATVQLPEEHVAGAEPGHHVLGRP